MRRVYGDGFRVVRALVAIVLGVSSTASFSLDAAEAPSRPARLLVATVTSGFRHASINTAEPVLEELGRSSGLYHLDYLRQPGGRPAPPKPIVRAAGTDDEAWRKEEAAFKVAQETHRASDAEWKKGFDGLVAKAFSPESLAGFDGVIFASTTGSLPIPDLTGFLEWIKGGKAFIGVHAATDTLAGSPAYVDMIGGTFAGHPWNAGGEHAFVVHEPAHRVVSMFPARFRWKDEIYQYAGSKPENLRVLVSLDMAASTPKEPWHVPVAWVRDYGRGRVFYTNFGHNDATWKEPMFQKHLAEGIAWAIGRFDAPAAANPDLQAAEYVRSVVVAAAAAAGRNADELLARADARIAKDPSWAVGVRPMLLGLRGLKPDQRAEAYEKFFAELDR